MEYLIIFVVTFVGFMAIYFIALMIGRSIGKKKLGNFKNYIQEKFPNIDLETTEILLAKQISKQTRPDIALLIDESAQSIIVLQDIQKEGITHHRYSYNELSAVESSDQIISRGMMPKTYSYEESLHLGFTDGQTYHLILENISNKYGNDQGADFVRNLFSPWRRKLNEILGK
jgi:hypothetical protein